MAGGLRKKLRKTDRCIRWCMTNPYTDPAVCAEARQRYERSRAAQGLPVKLPLDVLERAADYLRSRFTALDCLPR